MSKRMSEMIGLLIGTNVQNGMIKTKIGPRAPFLRLSNRANIYCGFLRDLIAISEAEKNPRVFASSQRRKAKPNFGRSIRGRLWSTVPPVTKSEYENITVSRVIEAIRGKLSADMPAASDAARNAAKKIQINNGPGLKEKPPFPLQKFLPAP
jgi:hypothetical protein